MLTDLLKRTRRGITHYRDTYPDMYAGYEKDLKQLQSKIDALLISINYIGRETPQPGDPMPRKEADA